MNTNQATTKQAIIYCRVSTKEQVEEGNSLSTQEKVCKEYALKNGYQIVETFIEQGESAKSQDRTELQRLLRYCADRKNKISAVIAYKIDRISRNTDDYSQIRILLKRYGVEIKSTSEYFEDTPAGRFMENIIANVAQFDNDVRTERSVGGSRDAMKEGRYVWLAPLGYDNIKINGKSTIAQNAMAHLVREAFERVAQNICPVLTVRAIMCKQGLATKKGKHLSKSQFFRFLKNEVYAGWTVKFGERHRGLYEPIVSQETFDQVGRVLRQRSHKTLQYVKENPDFPLRRFVKHENGETLTGGWSQGRKKKYPYYRFIKTNMGFRKDIFEDVFKSFADQFQLKEKHYAQLLQFAKENFFKQTDDNTKEAQRLEKHIEELKENQNLLVQKNLKGIITNSILRQHLDYIEKELMETQSAIARIPYRKNTLEAALHFVSAFLKNPSKTWDELPFAQKVALQRFNFPQGVLFDGKEFRTTKISNVLKGNYIFLRHESHSVHTMHESLNQQTMSQLETSPEGNSNQSVQVLPSNKRIVAEKSLLAKGRKRNMDDVLLADFSWEKYLEEIEELVDILKQE